MSNNIYDILKKMTRLDQPRAKKLNEGVYDIDNRSIGGDDNEIDRLEAALKDPNHPERAFLMGKYGINKRSDLAKLPGIRAAAEKGYTDKRVQRDADQAARNAEAEAELDRDLERMRKFGGTPGMNESKKKAKPDYLDMDKDGNKKEPMKKAVKDKEKGAIAEAVDLVESALMEKYMGFKKTVAAIKKGGSAENPEAVAAAIGRKKYGKEKFQKAAAAGKKLGEDDMEEGNEFSGALAQARAQGKDSFSVDGKTYQVKEGWDDMQAYLKKKDKDSESKGGAGKKAGKRYGGSAQKDDDSDTETKATDAPKKKGRPKKDKFAK